MARAIWNGTVIAESNDTVQVEGNHYFPHDSIKAEHFRLSTHHTVCGWKGTTSYYDIVVDDQTNSGAAWFYPDPKPDALHVKDRVAFWKGVQVEA